MKLTNILKDSPLQLNFCSNVFSQSRHLVIHLLNQIWYQFSVCWSSNFGLTCSKQLTLHLIKHMGGKPCDCNFCGKSCSCGDAIRTPADPHGRQAIHMQHMWKNRQLGGQYKNSYCPPSAGRTIQVLILSAPGQEEDNARNQTGQAPLITDPPPTSSTTL